MGILLRRITTTMRYWLLRLAELEILSFCIAIPNSNEACFPLLHLKLLFLTPDDIGMLTSSIMVFHHTISDCCHTLVTSIHPQ
ncbi:hypothetical protein SLEP1_g38448 [Rubroshorea leprosula]|nr:hypothetical protein SLEP1_g38448 [Rubroshorea leprosula]